MLDDLKIPGYFEPYSEVIPGETGAAMSRPRFNWVCGLWPEVSGLIGMPELSDFKVHRISTEILTESDFSNVRTNC